MCINFLKNFRIYSFTTVIKFWIKNKTFAKITCKCTLHESVPLSFLTVYTWCRSEYKNDSEIESKDESEDPSINESTCETKDEYKGQSNYEFYEKSKYTLKGESKGESRVNPRIQ